MADEPIEIGYYGAVVRRNALLVASIAVASALLAAAALSGTSYVSKTEVLIQPIASADSGTARADQLINTNTEQRIATSAAVASLAAETLDADDPESLLNHLDVQIAPESQVLVFSFSASEGDRARAGAQAFAEAYLEFRGEGASEARSRRIDELTQTISERTAALSAANLVVSRANAGGPDAPSRQDLADAQAAIQNLNAELGVLNNSLGRQQELRIDPGEVIGAATAPRSTQTSPLLLLILGGAVGAVIGAMAGFVRDRLRARVNTPSDLEAELHEPVLASIPATARSSAVMVTRTEPNAPAAHAYRRLAVTLLAGPKAPPRSVLIVSASKDEPRTAVALNLSVALLQQSRRVLLVSADRYDPKIDRTFDLAGAPGLDEHLAGVGRAEPEEVLRGLYVLPAGSGAAFPVHHVPPRQAVASILERGARLADVILIDAPPALDSPDAEVMGPIVDAVLVVAAADRTSRRDVAEVRSRMALVGAAVRGAVLVLRPSLRQRVAMFLEAVTSRASSTSMPDGSSAAFDAVEPAATTVDDLDRLGPVEPIDAVTDAELQPADLPGEATGDELTADAVALRDRIDELLRRHTTTGLPPDIGDRDARAGFNGGDPSRPAGRPTG